MTEQTRALETMLVEGARDFGVPGAALGMFHEGAETLLVTGVTSVEHPLPITQETLFQTGSTTKTLVATAVMRLVESGDLDLDEPVRTWVPELKMADESVADRVALRHLLTHSGGHDGDLFDDFGDGRDALSRFVAAMDGLPQLAPLGSVFTYSNAGFSLAGRAIEVVTGNNFERAVGDLVLQPLGMTHSFFLAKDCITERVAVGHRTADDGPKVTRPWQLSRSMGPAGGLASTVRDQITYARFHLGDGTTLNGERLLQPETMKLMQSPQIGAGGGRAAAIGLSWLIQSTPGVLAHGGTTNGQESSFVIVPDRGFAITVLTNADRGDQLHRRIVKWVLRSVLGLAPARHETPAATGALLDEVVGTYTSLIEVLRLARKDSGVTVEYTPTQALRRAAPETPDLPPLPIDLFEDGGFLVTQGPIAGQRGEFLRGDDGSIRWLRMLGRIHVRDEP